MNLKKKQHYVSQFYLKAWSKDQDRIFACDLKSKPFLVKTNATAYSKFFYRIRPLSYEAIRALENIVEILDAHNTTIYKKVIKSINRILLKWEIVKNIYPNEKIRTDGETNEIIKEFQTNIIEEYFSYFESKASPIITKIIQSENLHIDKKEYQELLFYMTLQFLRTRKVLDKAHFEFKKYHPDLTYEEMYTISIYVSLIINEKLHLSLLKDLNTLHIVKNCTEINIITSDNPCINYKLDHFNNKEFECIFPISPHIYLILKENSYSDQIRDYISKELENYPEENVINKLVFIEETSDTNKIYWVNNLIKRHCNRYLYAITEKDFI